MSPGPNLTDSSYILRTTRQFYFTYWDLLIFVSDGAFWRVWNDYTPDDHSTIMIDMIQTAPGQYVGFGRSKWGSGPVMEHKFLPSPRSRYSYYSMRAYKYMGNRP
jgi:hypothetical protein